MEKEQRLIDANALSEKIGNMKYEMNGCKPLRKENEYAALAVKNVERNNH